MKNNFGFEIGSMTITANNTPIELSDVKINIDLEADKHEMSQQISMIKELYDMFTKVCQPTSTITPAPVKHVCRCKDDNGIIRTTEKKSDQPKENIAEVWDKLAKMMPGDMGSTGFCRNEYHQKADDATGSKEGKVLVELNSKYISCHLTSGGKNIHLFRWEDKPVHTDSIPLELLDEFLSSTGWPENIQLFIKKFVKI